MTENLFAPHESREDVLLLAGRKPVAMFTLPGANPRKEAQIQRLDAAAAQGLVLRAHFESAIARRIFYCRPESRPAMEEVMAIYRRLDADAGPDGQYRAPHSPADHARIGQLFGYSPEAIAFFLARSAGAGPRP